MKIQLSVSVCLVEDQLDVHAELVPAAAQREAAQREEVVGLASAAHAVDWPDHLAMKTRVEPAVAVVVAVAVADDTAAEEHKVTMMAAAVAVAVLVSEIP